MLTRTIALSVAALAALFMLSAAPVAAQGDHDFVMKVAGDGLAEVALGQLATQRAGDPAVRAFGERMVADHGAANTELMRLAQQKGIALPTEPEARERSLRDRLAGLSGSEFDRAYMREMVDDHTNDVAEFTREAAQGTDADVKAWAAKTLPTLQDHLAQARAIEGRVAGVAPAPGVAAVPAPGVVTSPGVASASPGTTTVIVTTRPAPPLAWCDGAWHPTLGTNLAACPKPTAAAPSSR